MDSDNVEITGSKVPEVFVSHYEQFLGGFIECQELNVDGLFSNQVSDMASINMIRAITDEEIRATMFDIGDDRALVPDGYTSVFFKKGGISLGKMFVTRINGISWFLKGMGFEDKGDPLYSLFISVIINVCFADDLFIFARGDVESARVIMDSLDEFKKTSGLVPSIPKSTAYFCNVLYHTKLLSWYFAFFLRAKNRIEDWKNKSLSFAERLQLCQSVISSMHVYWASVLIIPKGIIHDIQQLIRGFCGGLMNIKSGKEVLQKVRRSPEEIRDITMVTVCLKLLTIRFKNTAMVRLLLSRWKMPKSFRLYG
ncbi:hypothetical protein Tco_1195610 [Tanacetum coccineum]